MTVTFAAIDVGSNAMRLAIGSFNSRGDLSIVATRRAPVRLGTEVFRSGKVSRARIEEGVAAFIEFEALARSHNVNTIRAVGTSALREATNSQVFTDKVRRATGINVEIISGDEEARLISAAVAAEIPLARGTTLLVDIGGGSVELSLLSRGRLIFSDSVTMGTVRLLEMVQGRARSDALLQRLMRRYAVRIRDQVIRTKGFKVVTRLVGTGGNFDTLCDLRRRLLGLKSGRELRSYELTQLTRRLGKMPVSDRINKLGLRPDRADVIMPAMALIKGILDETGVDSITIPGVGLREGVLRDLFDKTSPHSRHRSKRQATAQVKSYALQLGRRYGFDEQHALHAARLALQIFDQTKSLHQLKEEARLILEIAALLHDIGYFINSDDHHKHSGYIIRASHFVGLTERQRHLVALIARYHRGVEPTNRDPLWKELPRADRYVVSVASSIIRFVEELDSEHLQRISRVVMRRRRKVVTMKIHSRHKVFLERVGTKSRKEVLERALGISIAIG
jgi:exopolyphosphatase/guanosine-5'-triphosphate,3'-diphosphate pyrophosphatase